MAIGDSVVFELGAPEENHQPAAGVEEQITCVVKQDPTDPVAMYDGTAQKNFLEAEARPAEIQGDAAAVRTNPYNMAMMIDNGFYVRKVGTTTIVVFSGVQTNA